MLTIDSKQQGNVQVIAVNGRVDGFSAPQLDDSLQAAVKAKHYNVVVDLAGTEFLSSAGMRALLKARLETQDKGGDVRLANPSTFIMEAMKLVGLEKLFKIFNSQQAAISSFHAG